MNNQLQQAECNSASVPAHCVLTDHTALHSAKLIQLSIMTRLWPESPSLRAVNLIQTLPTLKSHRHSFALLGRQLFDITTVMTQSNFGFNSFQDFCVEAKYSLSDRILLLGKSKG